MPTFESKLDTKTPAYKKNKERMDGLVKALQSSRATVEKGGSDKSRERHLSRGKLLPRDRVKGLLDPGSPFLEVGATAAHDMRILVSRMNVIAEDLERDPREFVFGDVKPYEGR